MEQLLQEISLLENKLSSLRSKLRDFSDGYIYLTNLRCYGSRSWNTYTNTYLVQELCDQYNGDNGIVDVYTNNPSPSIIDNYSGDVHVMTTKELKHMSQGNVSMSQAIVNRITETLL